MTPVCARYRKCPGRVVGSLRTDGLFGSLPKTQGTLPPLPVRTTASPTSATLLGPGAEGES